MIVHHLNCATMCPLSARIVHGEGGFFALGRMVCHCLLIETEAGLVLVDSGFGAGDIRDPKTTLGSAFMLVVRPRLDIEETALRQVERLGFRGTDVRHILLTHLDLDHAGGISDFPKAKVHLYAPEHDAAMHPATTMESHRYRPMHWAHGPEWVLYRDFGDPWFGFDAVRRLEGLPPEILIVPLIGHTRGHAGIAVQTPQGWLLHAGDAYFYSGEMDPEHPRSTPGLGAFQRLVATDDRARRQNQARLRALAKAQGGPAGDLRIFSAHDVGEYETLRRAAEARNVAGHRSSAA